MEKRTSNVWKMGLNNKKHTAGCGYREVLENSDPELKATSTAYAPYNPQPHFFQDDTRFNHLFENPLASQSYSRQMYIQIKANCE